MSDTLNFVLAHPNEAADRIEALEAALRSADKLNEFIAGAYILSLADFRYLNTVSTEIRAALAPERELRWREANKRIEALEAALRAIALDGYPATIRELARAALAPEQDKAADDELDAMIEEMKRRHEE